MVRLHGRGREAARYDMWGVPVPAGRGRDRDVTDPTVSNPFSLTLPPDWDGERERPRTVKRPRPRSGAGAVAAGCGGMRGMRGRPEAGREAPLRPLAAPRRWHAYFFTDCGLRAV